MWRSHETPLQRVKFPARPDFASGSGVGRKDALEKLAVRDIALNEFAAGRDRAFDLHRTSIVDVIDGDADLFEVHFALAKQRAYRSTECPSHDLHHLQHLAVEFMPAKGYRTIVAGASN